MARILEDVVPGEGARPRPVRRRCWEDCLLKNEGRAPVPTHPVEHPQERCGNDGGETGGERRGCTTQRPEDRYHQQSFPAAEPVSRKGYQESSHCPAREARSDDVSDLLRVEPEFGEVNPEENTDQSRRECAQKCRDV